MTEETTSPVLAKLRADFIAPYIERDRLRAIKKYQTADVIDFAAKTGIRPPPPPDPAAIRAQFAATDPSTKQFIKDAHAEGLISGLRDVTFFASKEEADAAWDELGGYVELRPAMLPRRTPINQNTACRFSAICNRTECFQCKLQKLETPPMEFRPPLL